MILIDSSAWIEFLRGTDSRICRRVDQELEADTATCAVVRMELLAGARDEAHLRAIRGLLARSTDLAVDATHYDQAAAVYRTCRRFGSTPRHLVDCVIAAVAIEAGVAVLHADTDLERIARHTNLQLA